MKVIFDFLQVEQKEELQIPSKQSATKKKVFLLYNTTEMNYISISEKLYATT